MPGTALQSLHWHVKDISRISFCVDSFFASKIEYLLQTSPKPGSNTFAIRIVVFPTLQSAVAILARSRRRTCPRRYFRRLPRAVRRRAAGLERSCYATAPHRGPEFEGPTVIS